MHQHSEEGSAPPTGAPAGDPEHEGHSDHAHLSIFVNRRKFGPDDGVKERMTGAEIAALVDVPKEVAVVRRAQPHPPVEVGVDESIRVRQGEHFLVTRRHVDGG